MKNVLFMLQAVTPVHYGCGQGEGDIDMPVVRDITTMHPKIPGDGLKGVLKDYYLSKPYDDTDDKKKIESLFSNGGFASAFSGGEGHLLALPMRSFFGTFTFVTSPYVLACFKKLLKRVGCDISDLALPDFGTDSQKCYVTDCSILLGQSSKVLLNEIALEKGDAGIDVATAWADEIISLMRFTDDTEMMLFKSRFSIVPDDVFNFFCETSLPVEPHIAIDSDTGSTKNGALWYEETVPVHSIFYGNFMIDNSHCGGNIQADELAELLRNNKPEMIQLGGRATTGKGFVELIIPDVNNGGEGDA